MLQFHFAFLVSPEGGLLRYFLRDSSVSRTGRYRNLVAKVVHLLVMCALLLTILVIAVGKSQVSDAQRQLLARTVAFSAKRLLPSDVTPLRATNN